MVSFNQVLEKLKETATQEGNKIESATAYTDMASQRKKAANILGRMNESLAGRTPSTGKPKSPREEGTGPDLMDID